MKQLQGWVLIVALFAWLAPGYAQQKLVFVGSSTSACAGATNYSTCYVGRLDAHYNQVFPFDSIVDHHLARGGTNCYNGMPSSYVPPRPEAIYQPIVDSNITAALKLIPPPTVLIVNYPSNAYDVLSVTEIMFCLRTIRDSANKKGVPCFVTTSQPRTSPASFNTSAIKKKFAEIKDSVLLEFGSFALDFYTNLINPIDSSIRYDAGDGIHMNDIGHDSLYQRVLRANVFLATLPLSFIQFNAQAQGSGNVISWTTTNESGVNYFEVQKSNDHISFSRIATLPANNAAGVNNYRFVDNQPQAGTAYYRIVEVDNDGKKQLTPVMTVRAGTTPSGINKVIVAGNQLVMDVFLDKSSEGEVRVLNNTGVTVARSRQNLAQGNSSVYINTPSLSAGIYYLRLQCGSEIMTRSFVKY